MLLQSMVLRTVLYLKEKSILKKSRCKSKILQIVSALTQQEISEDALLVINSGRYEFKNKGIDLFIDAVAQLKIQFG